MSFSAAAKKPSSSDSVGIFCGGTGDRMQRDLVLVICSSSVESTSCMETLFVVVHHNCTLTFQLVHSQPEKNALHYYNTLMKSSLRRGQTQTAFVLYGPVMPSGCKLRENSVTCDSIDSEVWGELLANIQLFVAVLVVLVGTVASYGFAASRYGNSEVKNLHAIQAELDHD
ncbi:hypothetical protein D0Y65_053957 [Glycine soja]|uniref:Uncharacterized protein n=1 Tax=Glycine soja TaxID=3848 RepID=A0A445F4H4_GLYSO|nr:hypothetical protein D0Y65_053957 [Glycine soja]